MWDVIARDFDKNTSAESCLNNVIDNVEEGSIIVLHDNEKSFNLGSKIIILNKFNIKFTRNYFS